MSDVTIPGGKIRSFVERIENIDGELAELNEQKKEVFRGGQGRRVRCEDPEGDHQAAQAGRRTSATSARACSISTCARWKPPHSRSKVAKAA